MLIKRVRKIFVKCDSSLDQRENVGWIVLFVQLSKRVSSRTFDNKQSINVNYEILKTIEYVKKENTSIRDIEDH